MNGRGTTTIEISTHTYKNLKKITRKREPFNNSVAYLLHLHYYACELNETNRDGIEELLVED